MRMVRANNMSFHVVESGSATGPAVVFANSLGTDLRLWDAILPFLPDGFRYVRYDMRGHGLSECPDGPYSIADLAADAEALIETLQLGPVMFIGLSIGGMIGLSLAARKPDLVRALVFSNSAAKMGTSDLWRGRIEAIRKDGLQSLEVAILDRWFGPDFRTTPEAALWGAMLSRSPQEGYLACCAAIADADLTDITKTLRLPFLAIAGSHDGASPAELVAETAALIPSSVCQTIQGAGHLPCVETPQAYAAVLTPFLESFANA